MSDTEIVEWISKNPDVKLWRLVQNFENGFCRGMSFRELVEAVCKWEKSMGYN